MGEPILYCHTCDIAQHDTAGFVKKYFKYHLNLGKI